jgi:hypothetical protein
MAGPLNHLSIDGWGVAQVELERSWSGRDLADICWLFRTASTWTWVRMRRAVKYSDAFEPSAGSAVVTTMAFGSLDDVAAHVRAEYTSDAWVQLLDAGCGHDAELRREWVPERIRRDFDDASIHVKDLARYTDLLGGRPLPAPGREMPEWQDYAVAQMAAQLEELGFEVDDEPPAFDVVDNVFGDPALGTLLVRRYGWEAIGVVRVDDVGEVFIRLPDPSDVDGPVFQPVAEGAA